MTMSLPSAFVAIFVLGLASASSSQPYAISDALSTATTADNFLVAAADLHGSRSLSRARALPTANTRRVAQARAPELIEIVPSSGPAGQAYPMQATIRGTGFMPAGNIVDFGRVKIPDLSSADGTRITFAVPKNMPSRGEVPPLVLPPNDYPVTVTTASGTSNSLTFTLTRGP